MTTRLLQPGEIAQATDEPPFAIAPDPATVFADRARRFGQLAAAGHAQGDWLRFLAAVAQAQHDALQSFPEVPLPDADALQQAARHLMPPVPATGWPRDPAWRKALQAILRNVQEDLPAAARAIANRLLTVDDAALEALAGRLLDLAPGSTDDRAAGVFVAAALQVYWTALAARLPASALQRLDTKGVCPCCGGLPVASVVRVGGAVANLRFLHCALCNTEWNLVRVACAACDDGEKIAYRSLEGHHPAVRAETCDACHGYLKIVVLEKDPLADPVADDLATTALDLLLDEAGYERTGPNLFLLAGS